MGLDYALVHLKYTITPAILFSLLYRPLFTYRDLYRLAFLIIIAVIATIPWDSYLIRTNIWSYPPDAVLGSTVFSIPIEELFFFVIQTYDVSMLYMLISKPTFYPAYLRGSNSHTNEAHNLTAKNSILGWTGQIFFFSIAVTGAYLVQTGTTGTYMGLILVWAFPFLLFLWSLCKDFMLRIPVTNVILPIAIATLYLWIVDTLSLQRGTWVIEEGTKCGLHLWQGLELEEAIFFLVTNMLIVFGQIAFDNAVAIIDLYGDVFPTNFNCPSPWMALKALSLPVDTYNPEKVLAVSQALQRLKQKSRSFYLASSAFEGRLRTDLIFLYSFCRLADDLIDAANTKAEAKLWIEKLRKYLDMAYNEASPTPNSDNCRNFIQTNFSKEARLALMYLPVSYLSPAPLYDLLKGFELDLEFPGPDAPLQNANWPIKSVVDLKQYGVYVAGTVAELCLDLVLYHSALKTSNKTRSELKEAAITMGIALQTVNISRDIQVDAQIGRVYIPVAWLKERNMTPEMVLKDPSSKQINMIRTDLLNLAFQLYQQARPSIEELPPTARGPMRVAIESYMEIGRVLRSESYQVKAGKATVPIGRRILVACQNLHK